MTDLKYLNLGHNQLSGQLSDMFGQLPSLSVLDLSFNSMSGSLPQSFASLSSIRTMHLENNQFTGTINVLGSLPLEELSVADNKFTGWIPNKLKNIDTLETEGNSWSSGPAPPGTSSGDQVNNHHSSKGANKSVVAGGTVAAIVISILVLIVILLVLFARRSSASHASHFLDEEKIGHSRPFTPLVSQEFKEPDLMAPNLSVKSLQTAASMGLKPPPSDRHKSFNDTEFGSKFNVIKSQDPINTTMYSLEELQQATGRFGAKYLLGQGSIGFVYKAKYPDGKVLAVKMVSSESSEDFANVVSGITRLQHANIIKLVGYCSELTYRLLVYEFMRNGSLYDFLHLSDEYSKPLTWNTRIRIALGTARALEYLHEGCSPATVHGNIKSANILLDAELKPHLSDCGLTNFYQHAGKSSAEGYSSPECTKSAAFTLKGDVHTFGVVMLELLTGRMPFDNSRPKAEQCLVQWATPQLHDIDALDKMVDPALRGLYPPKSLSRFADVIALCVQLEPEFRPAMSEVVQSLVRCERA